jgi:hypothetical protein
MISGDLAYKPSSIAVIERHRSLWNRNSTHQILAEVRPYDLMMAAPLAACPDIEGMVQAWGENYRVRAIVDDDCLPVARASFGSAAFGVYLGADVIFDGSGGWCKPLLQNYRGLDQLTFDPQNSWIIKQQLLCERFVEAARGKFAVCETEPIDGLNLVESLRGSAAYTDIYDNPDEVHRLLEFSVEFNIRLLEMQRKILAPVLYHEDGLFSMFRIWLPGNTIWMSVDAYGNCSPRIFREFGAPYLQRAIDHFNGGWIHMHSFSLHLIPEIMRLKGVVGLEIFDDPNQKRGFPALRDIRRLTGELPIQVDCTKNELETAMYDHTLPGGVMYIVKDGVQTVKEANLLMKKVRDYHELS